MENKTYKIAFVGVGMIGAGLAANAMMNGHKVMLYDIRDLEAIRKQVEMVIAVMVRAGALTEDAGKEALKNAGYTSELKEAVEGADLVQECLPERLELKQSVYASIQEITGPDTIIASSTSSLFPTKLQEGAKYPGSILVAHPYNPSHLIPLIEVCGGEQTDAECIKRTMEIYKAIGKVPIECKKEIEGFLVNRISWAVMHGAQEAVKEGLCSVEDIDKAIMFGPGMRMAVTGQLLTISLGTEGGFRAVAQKYGKEPTPEDEMYAQGVEAEIANRPEELGNTIPGVCEFRDHMFVEMLKLQHLL